MGPWGKKFFNFQTLHFTLTLFRSPLFDIPHTICNFINLSFTFWVLVFQSAEIKKKKTLHLDFSYNSSFSVTQQRLQFNQNVHNFILFMSYEIFVCKRAGTRVIYILFNNFVEN